MISNLYNFTICYIKENNIKIDDETDLIKIRYDICKEFVKLGRLFSTKTFDHKLYPKISESRGRPRISWKHCAHHGCSYDFSTVRLLRDHLDGKNIYIPYYSKSHEIIDTKYKFNDKTNKFHCLSPLCDFSCDNEKTMEKHFRLLGIAPYYQNGDIIHDREYYKFYIDTNQFITPYTNFNKLAENIDTILKYEFKFTKEDLCCCCLENKPNVIFSKCAHRVICSNCASKIFNKRCPICKQISTKLDEIDLSMEFFHPNAI